MVFISAYASTYVLRLLFLLCYYLFYCSLKIPFLKKTNSNVASKRKREATVEEQQPKKENSISKDGKQ